MSVELVGLSEMISQTIVAVERAAWIGNLLVLAVVGLFLLAAWRSAQRRKEQSLAEENALLAEELRGLVTRIDRRMAMLEQSLRMQPPVVAADEDHDERRRVN
jgi:hypothetical protein